MYLILPKVLSYLVLPKVLKHLMQSIQGTLVLGFTQGVNVLGAKGLLDSFKMIGQGILYVYHIEKQYMLFGPQKNVDNISNSSVVERVTVNHTAAGSNPA